MTVMNNKLFTKLLLASFSVIVTVEAVPHKEASVVGTGVSSPRAPLNSMKSELNRKFRGDKIVNGGVKKSKKGRKSCCFSPLTVVHTYSVNEENGVEDMETSEQNISSPRAENIDDVTTGRTAQEIRCSAEREMEECREYMARGSYADFLKGVSSQLRSIRKLHKAAVLLRETSESPEMVRNWRHTASESAAQVAEYLPYLPEADPRDEDGYTRFSPRRMQGTLEVLTPRAGSASMAFRSWLENN